MSNSMKLSNNDMELDGNIMHYQGKAYNLSDERQYDEAVNALLDNGLEIVVDLIDVMFETQKGIES